MDVPMQAEQRTWNTAVAVEKAARTPSTTDVVLGQLSAEMERLGRLIGQLEERLVPVLAEDRPRPEEAPEPPPGSSPLVYLLGNMRNALGVHCNALHSVLGRLEVG